MEATLIAKQIAGNVRAEIARTRINQQQIADALGQNQQYVSRRVVGRVAWRVDELAVIARMLGVEPGDLFQVPGNSEAAPGPKTGSRPSVAGARFELATSGLRARPARTATIIPFPAAPQTPRRAA